MKSVCGRCIGRVLSLPVRAPSERRSTRQDADVRRRLLAGARSIYMAVLARYIGRYLPAIPHASSRT